MTGGGAGPSQAFAALSAALMEACGGSRATSAWVVTVVGAFSPSLSRVRCHCHWPAVMTVL